METRLSHDLEHLGLRNLQPATLQHGQRPQQLLWETIVDSQFSNSSMTFYDDVRLNFERYGY